MAHRLLRHFRYGAYLSLLQVPNVRCNWEGTRTLLQCEYDQLHSYRTPDFSRKWKENVLNSTERSAQV